MKMIISVVAVAALALTGCVKKASPTNDPAAGGEGKIVMASADAGGHCSAKKAEMASADGTKAHCATKKDASMADGSHCKTKDASAQLASAEMDCKDCPKTAEGKCDHEAGAKLGKDCCKKALQAKVN